MKTISMLAAAAVLAIAARADTRFFAEAGASHAFVDNSDAAATPGFVIVSKHDDSARFAPYVAGGVSFSERFRLRFSYHYLSDLDSRTVEVPEVSPAVFPPIQYYRNTSDDVHIVGVAPEFTWPLRQRLSLNVSPMLNWVVSRGVISRGSNSPLVSSLPSPPLNHRDDAITLGASAGLVWALGERADAAFSYQYTDLDPSFGRTAHLLSAGLRWRF
jgi:hypothetical protein